MLDGLTHGWEAVIQLSSFTRSYPFNSQKTQIRCLLVVVTVAVFVRNAYYLKNLSEENLLPGRSRLGLNFDVATSPPSGQYRGMRSTVQRLINLAWLLEAHYHKHRAAMATLSSPLRVCRGILKELRAIHGPSYKKSPAYNYVMEQFRKNKASFALCFG